MSDNQPAPDTSTTGVVRDSLQITSLSIVTLCVIAVVAVAYILKPVLVPLVLALLIAGALDPIITRVDRARIPRPITAAIVVGGFLVALVLGIWSFSTPVTEWVRRVPEQLELVDTTLNKLRQPVQEVAEEVDELRTGDAEKVYQPTVSIEEERLSSLVATTAVRVVGYFFLTIVLLYFVIGFGHTISLKLRTALGHDLPGEIAGSISAYLFKITMINAGLGLCIGIAMWIVDMPYPQLWGLLGFAMNFLPYIGAIVGLALLTFVSSITFDTLTWVLIPPGIYMLLTSLEANFITPTLLGMGFPLNPLVLFMWVLLCTFLWGVIGALIAVPLLMALRLTCSHFPRLEFIGDLIGEMPGNQRGARFRRVETKHSNQGGRSLPG